MLHIKILVPLWLVIQLESGLLQFSAEKLTTAVKIFFLDGCLNTLLVTVVTIHIKCKTDSANLSSPQNQTIRTFRSVPMNDACNVSLFFSSTCIWEFTCIDFTNSSTHNLLAPISWTHAPNWLLNWRVIFTFIAANSAANCLKMNGMATVSIPLLVLQEWQMTFLGALPGGSPPISRAALFWCWIKEVARMLPQSEHTSAIW